MGRQIKNLARNKIIYSSVALAILITVASPLAYAAKPYFKAFGADVMTGGWFNEGSPVCTTSTSYQKATTGDEQRGGIIAYSKTTATTASPARRPAGGSSTQYAALSVGRIDGTFGSPQNEGFTSSGATAANNTADRLSFANNQDDLGGLFEGGPVGQGNCIPDYFNVKRNITTSSPLPSLSCPAIPAGDFYYAAPDNTPVVLNGGAQIDIAPGCKRSVFVQGNVYIQSNIVYSGSPTADSVPKFALVVLGNIFIAPGVNRLDGMYVAQPLPECGPPSNPSPCTSDPVRDDTGTIWTCHENLVNTPAPAFLAGNCSSKLTVNGSLIAKQVYLVRNGTDVGSATVGETAAVNGAAESINYTPAMVLGGPFFNDLPGNELKIQSLVSLPPIF